MTRGTHDPPTDHQDAPARRNPHDRDGITRRAQPGADHAAGGRRASRDSLGAGTDSLGARDHLLWRLARQIRTIPLRAKDPRLDALLDEISEAEYQQGRGMLSVVVINRRHREPGWGFFQLGWKLGRAPERTRDWWRRTRVRPRLLGRCLARARRPILRRLESAAAPARSRLIWQFGIFAGRRAESVPGRRAAAAPQLSGRDPPRPGRGLSVR